MFGLFKKKSELERLQKVYAEKMSEVHKLSTIDRRKSDVAAAEADAIAQKIAILQNSQKSN
ncbi:Lacal_2735 family protein [Algoriphagus halophytocola]|uniref:Lacal_2735 family protein n=1 Tax=Algoriphagus halophytocola TaxID=2991499 RepID=A0ABY6MMY1_9BACT|nr:MULTISPECIES: Lacal_2735 family protein [unclassified Algoriphagus]UZD24046.1 Lacal_2735 family protein [Algoriphagus sp. TR-M5]WBL41418.1 Lacal_2735 family protein [Algoriphagus sp. TR-M9]